MDVGGERERLGYRQRIGDHDRDVGRLRMECIVWSCLLFSRRAVYALPSTASLRLSRV